MTYDPCLGLNQSGYPGTRAVTGLVGGGSPACTIDGCRPVARRQLAGSFSRALTADQAYRVAQLCTSERPRTAI